MSASSMASNAKGVKIGCFADSVEGGKKWRDLGVKFIGYGCDTQYIIGTAYRDGGLLIPDAAKAQKLLERAAEQDLDVAQYALGKLYL